MDVCVEYLLGEECAGDCIEGLADVYCCEKCTVCRFGSVKTFECCLCEGGEKCCCGVEGSETVLCGGEGNVWCDVCENQPLEYFDRVTKEGDRSVGGWLCGCLVWFQDGNYFGFFPKGGDTIVGYGLVEDGGEGPDGDRPQMFKVPVGNAIRACGAGGRGFVYCGLDGLGGKGGREVSVEALSVL